MTRLAPPGYLDPAARAAWNTLLEEIMAAGAATRVPPDRLLELTMAVRQHDQAAQLAAQSGVLIEHEGRAIENPAVAAEAKAAARVKALRRELGLGRRPLPEPVSRQAPLGRPAPLGRWCDTHQRYECTGSKRGGGDCHGSPVRGTPHCTNHLGMARDDPRVVLAQERVRNPISGEPMRIDAAAALRWRVEVLAGEVARLDLIIGGLDAEELVWGVVAEERSEGGEQATVRTTRAARLSVWVELRAQRERMLQSACEAALRAGIEERLVRVYEEEGAMLLKALLLALGRLGHPADDPQVPAVLGEVVREITAAS